MAGIDAAPRLRAPGPGSRRFGPSMLLGSAGAGDREGHRLEGRAPRTLRDWVVDVVLFLVAVLFGVIAFDGLQPRTDLLDAADAVGGAVLCCALWVRRRWPVGTVLLATPLGAFASCSGGAGAILLFSLAVHRETRTVLIVAALQVPTIFAYAALRPDPELSFWWLVLFVHVVLGLLLGWGTVVRSRRELVRSLQERAIRAESEQQLRVAQARDHERARIAREMHDVLAHRISLLSLHAGALEFRRDASPDEVAAAAGVIRTSAHEALEDLRQVIGVLRDGDSTAAGDGPDDGAAASATRPQPGLGDLPALLRESRSAGMRIVDHLEVAGDPPPGAIGRTAYRVVQEGLTNARKHAWGAVVHVGTAGGPGEGLTVEVRTPAAVGGTGRDPGIPGTGTGLVGLQERTALAGGRLETGTTSDGGFLLRAWLPWSAA